MSGPRMPVDLGEIEPPLQLRLVLFSFAVLLSLLLTLSRPTTSLFALFGHEPSFGRKLVSELINESR